VFRTVGLYFIKIMLAKDFYSLIFSEESVTNFLISKILLVNYKNAECPKCGSETKYYLIKGTKKRKTNFEVQKKRMKNFSKFKVGDKIDFNRIFIIF